MEQPNLTRRTLLASIPVATAVAALPAVAATASADSGLAQAFAAYQRIKAEADHFHKAICDPAEALWEKRCAAIPHVTTTRQFKLAGNGEMTPLCTAEEASVEIARHIVSICRNTSNDDYVECCRELVAAADERDAQIAKAREELNIDELGRRSDSYVDGKYAALRDIEDYPVTSPSDLLRKIEMLRENFGEDEVCDDWMLTDLRRIEGRA